ncbi:HAMP domain-containing sensor histidine kinase [Actinocrinis sp.]|uniref:sensor histidine kinase n=1 Tax=Actinocrinis sp. TaxID=1920516 RepID=UPI002DDCF896|nr:HAMP domain-containing sensor histidine kinase [Actinocrinis sp.]
MRVKTVQVKTVALSLTLRARIALAGGLAVFAALLAASLVLYPLADHDLHDQLDGELITTVTTAPKLGQALKTQIASNDGYFTTMPPLTIGDTLIQFVGADGLASGTSGDLAPTTEQDVEVVKGLLPAYFQSIKYQGRSYEMYTASFGNGILVRAAKPDSETTASLDRLRFLLAALVLGGALLAGSAARLLAGRVLRPVRKLTETVEHVTVTQDLATRVDTGGRDEIGRLARSFTAMMSALDASVQKQRHLVADASHELRTPLTSLTTNLELLAEAGGLADPQAPALLGAAREQSGELRALINDLVDLARYGESEPHCEDLRLDLLAAEVVERAAKRAPRLRFETRLAACLVYADPDAIERALGNLVDNAVKWSPPEGTVRVAVAVTGRAVRTAPTQQAREASASPGASDEVRFSVADEGPGVPPDDLPHIFDRFYRSTAARAKPGSGLGLSIVRQIADTHGGRVSAHPLSRGVEMRFTLPRTQ